MSSIQLVNVGFGNLVAATRIIAILAPDSAPSKRLVADAREAGMLIDASHGRKTRAIMVLDSGHVMLSGLQTETLGTRVASIGADEN